MEPRTIPSRLNHDHRDHELERFGTPRNYVAVVSQEISEQVLRSKLKDRKKKDDIVRLKVTGQMFDALCTRAENLDCKEEDIVRVALALFLGLDHKSHF